MDILSVTKHALMITFFVFVMMYANGMVPFSVLLTTSFIQDGHGMLPMLSCSLKDSVLIKRKFVKEKAVAISPLMVELRSLVQAQ